MATNIEQQLNNIQLEQISSNNPTYVKEIFHRLEQSYDPEDCTFPADLLYVARYNWRELGQCPEVKDLPTSQFITDIAASGLFEQGTRVEVEWNGIGQLDPTGEYTKVMLDQMLAEFPEDVEIALHFGSNLKLAQPSIDFITQHTGRDRIRFNAYGRLGKKPIEGLREIITAMRQPNYDFDITKLRGGIEHNSREWIRTINSKDDTELSTFLTILEELSQVASANNLERMSIPETCGTLQPSQAYAYTAMNLLLAHNAGYTPQALELHFHDDLGNAKANLLAAAQAIDWVNNYLAATELGHQIEAHIDFNGTGGGERVGINSATDLAELGIIPQWVANNLAEVERKHLGIVSPKDAKNLYITTAGTHVDMFANMLAEQLNINNWDGVIAWLNSSEQHRIQARSAILEFMQATYASSLGIVEDLNLFQIFTGPVGGTRSHQLSSLVSNPYEPILSTAQAQELQNLQKIQFANQALAS
jgi:hypothetical protein